MSSLLFILKFTYLFNYFFNYFRTPMSLTDITNAGIKRGKDHAIFMAFYCYSPD